jgi:hypothetical protein
MNLREINSALFGDYLHEFTSAYGQFCRGEFPKIMPFHQRYNFEPQEIIEACQEPGGDITLQILKIHELLIERYSDALNQQDCLSRKSRIKDLTLEAAQLLFTGGVGEYNRENKNYPRYIFAYQQLLNYFEQRAIDK